ncbi:MAG: hypothetical protein DMG10_27215, partial [Acidobacteria bacterium]
GGGATLTGTPSTDTPAKVVPPSFEDAAAASAALFDCERITVMLTMQPVGPGRTHADAVSA